MHLKFTSPETVSPTKLCTNKILEAAAVRHSGTLTLPLSGRIKLFIRTRKSIGVFLPKLIMVEEIEEDTMSGPCSGHSIDISPSK